MIRLLDWYLKRRTARGLVLAGRRYEAREGAGLNAMVYRALVDASVLARSIGRQNDAQMLAHEARHLRSAFDDLLWNEQEGAYAIS